MLTSTINIPSVMKYQRLISQSTYSNRKILESNYTCGMHVTRILMLKNQCKQFVVFAMIVCLSVITISSLRNAVAATTTSTVEVNIVSTINLVAQNGIVFGDISSSAIPGTVTIGTNGSRTTTGGATVNSNTSGTPALYEVSGDPNALYNITLPSSIVLSSAAGDKLIVNNFISIPAENAQLDAGGRQSVNVGATLNIGSFQPFGAYKGIMSTTVEYN